MWNRLGYGHGADEIVFIEEHVWHGFDGFSRIYFLSVSAVFNYNITLNR